MWPLNMILVMGVSCVNAEWQKIMLPTYGGAVCLDGSPGGFYYRQGNGSKWLIFHQGGGWCSSHLECYERAQTELGSSRFWAASLRGVYGGTTLFRAPQFHHFHVVYALYCDGGSWIGNGQTRVNGKQVYYRGRPLLDALLAVMIPMGLSHATEVIYSGCSAGALAVYFNVDYVHRRILKVNPRARVVGIADSMFTFEYPLSPFSKRMRWGYQAWNVSGAIHQSCTNSFNRTRAWYCMFAENLVPFIDTSLFILESENDCWQQAAYVNLNCRECKTQLEHTKIQKLKRVPLHMAVFLTRCGGHCVTAFENTEEINGSTVSEAFIEWYANVGANYKRIGDDFYFNGVFSVSKYLPNNNLPPCARDGCVDQNMYFGWRYLGILGVMMVCVSIALRTTNPMRL